MHLLGLALLVLAAGCWKCDIGSHAIDVYEGMDVRQGEVAAPPTWGVPATIDEQAGVGCPGGVPTAWECAESDNCQTACFEVKTPPGPAPGNAMVSFGFVVSGLPWDQALVLPDSRASVEVLLWTDDRTLAAGPIALASGTLQVVSWKNNFDARFALDATATDGQHVTIANGRFAILGGHWASQCKKGD